MPDVDSLTPEQRCVVEAYRDVRNRLGELAFGDAMAAVGMAANSVMQSLPPQQRMAVARQWADVFVRNAYAAIELGDA